MVPSLPQSYRTQSFKEEKQKHREKKSPERKPPKKKETFMLVINNLTKRLRWEWCYSPVRFFIFIFIFKKYAVHLILSLLLYEEVGSFFFLNIASFIQCNEAESASLRLAQAWLGCDCKY